MYGDLTLVTISVEHILVLASTAVHKRSAKTLAESHFVRGPEEAAEPPVQVNDQYVKKIMQQITPHSLTM